MLTKLISLVLSALLLLGIGAGTAAQPEQDAPPCVEYSIASLRPIYKSSKRKSAGERRKK